MMMENRLRSVLAMLSPIILFSMPVWAQLDLGIVASDGSVDCASLGVECDANGNAIRCVDPEDPHCTPRSNQLCPCTVVIDLGLAAVDLEAVHWDSPSPVEGQGVYDGQEWAVVFKYDSVHIPSGVTLKFEQHPKRAPVVWLVTGDVTIDGTVDLSGEAGVALGIAESGPGGFRGGRAGEVGEGSGGFGPGGGPYTPSAWGFGGSYGTLRNHGCGFAGALGEGLGAIDNRYGNERIIPLVGGSGGSPRRDGQRFETTGGGGGAILIAASSEIQINGSIIANGGNVGNAGEGSGGAIRLVADTITGSGALRAQGPVGGCAPGGDGRIRLEGNLVSLTDPGAPEATIGLPENPPMLWPSPTAPTLQIVDIGGVTPADDPAASLAFPNADVSLTVTDPLKVVLSATNVPTTSTVIVRVVPVSGDSMVYPASLVSGDATSSTWSAIVEFKNGFSAIQARAILP